MLALPRPLTELVDRELEVPALSALLAQVRLLTITGPGGVGKTRVAIAVAGAADFPDGAAFVDLAPVADPALVLPTLALAFGVHDSAGAPPFERIADSVGRRRLLLVLDNCEQVAETAPELARLLAATPGLTILATSRVPLRISGEHEYALAPLPLPALPSAAAIAEAPAVQLFVQRARAVRADFALSDANAATIAAICARLDGLPLALELAAAQLRTLAPAGLLARLERRLPLLTGGPRDAPARQRTLRDAIAGSVDLLAPEERRGFWRMAIFVGGCTLDTLAAVCVEEPGDELAALGLVDTLVAHSLLQRRGGDQNQRYVMLETVREYAAELLAASGEERSIRERHVASFVALAEAAEDGLLSGAHGHWFDRLSAERENYSAAVEWALAQGDNLVAARVGAALWRFWWVRGGIQQGFAWLQAGLAALARGDDPADDGARAVLRARALTAAGNLALALADYTLAEGHHYEALTLYRARHDRFGVGRSLYNLGLVAELQGDVARAEQCYRACMEEDQREPFRNGVGLFLRGLSATALARGDGHQAYLLARQAVEAMVARNQTVLLIQGLLQLGLAALALGRPDEAEGHACEAIAILSENLGQVWLAEALMVLASAIAHKDPRRAARAFAAAEQLLAHHHAPLAPKTYAQIVPYVRSVHSQLGPAGFAAAWREGQGLAFDEVVCLAEPAATREPAAQPVAALPPAAPVAPAAAGACWAPYGPDALSARELEILRLLSAGLTNKAIAERLLMSVNTVHSHVKSIFGKLDVSTRSAATRAALVRGLVEA